MDRELPVSSKSGAGDQVVSNSSETNEMKLATLERGRGGEISIIVHCICRAISLSGVGLVLSSRALSSPAVDILGQGKGKEALGGGRGRRSTGRRAVPSPAADQRYIL